MKSAEQMLRENRRWRRQNKVDSILENGLDTFFKLNYPLHLGIFDKRSRPGLRTKILTNCLKKNKHFLLLSLADHRIVCYHCVFFLVLQF